jgi:dTDP-D-glucose 4,6-dehydratase
MLNSDFSKKNLKWRTKYDLEQTIKLTSLWYKELINEQGKNILKFSQDQIRDYIK